MDRPDISDLIPKCGGCQGDLRETIVWNLSHGQPYFAQKVLGKERIKAPQDLVKGMNFCTMCGYEFTPQEKGPIAKYAELYLQRPRG